MLLPPEIGLQEEEQVLARIRSGRRMDHQETVRVTKDGRRLDVSVTVSLVKNHDGEIIAESQRSSATSPIASGRKRRCVIRKCGIVPSSTR